MNNEFRKIIQALCGTNEAGKALGTPDGIIDASSMIDHLKYLTKDGRPLKSDEQSAFTTVLGNWQQSQFGGGTVDDFRNCMVGDDDAINLSHTCEMYESIPGAQLAVVPGASHGLPLEKPETVVRIIDDFFSQQLPVETLIPIRRK